MLPQLPGDSNDGKRQYSNERDLLFASFRPMTLLEHGIEIVTPIYYREGHIHIMTLWGYYYDSVPRIGIGLAIIVYLWYHTSF